MMAMPAVDPKAAAPAPPMMAPAPAAMNGAAKPPVKPASITGIHGVIASKF